MKVSLHGTEAGYTLDCIQRHLEVVTVKPLVFEENGVFPGR